MTTLKLVEKDHAAPPPMTGAEALRQVADLIEKDLLPAVPLDDPLRGALTVMALAAPSRWRSAQAGRIR